MRDELRATIARVRQQQKLLQFSQFSNENAYELGVQAVAAARGQDLPITIDIRRHGHQLFHAARPGTSPNNDAWIDRKVRLVDKFGDSSYLVYCQMELDGATVEPSLGLDPLLYVAAGGSFPIILRGSGPIGTVTVSGLKQEEDHDFVVRVVAAYLKSIESGPGDGK